MVYNNSNVSRENAELLRQLEASVLPRYLPAAMFVFILSIIGTIGNLHIVFVYLFKMRRSTRIIFILALAFVDLTTCVLTMPFVVVTNLKPLTFNNIPACKMFSTSGYFSGTSSGFILAMIAIDRHRRISKPLARQIGKKLAMFLCGLSVVLSTVFSWPALLLYTVKPRKIVPGYFETEVSPNITGLECNYKEELRSSWQTLVFNSSLLILSGTGFVLLVVLYSITAYNISRHLQFRTKFLSKQGRHTVGSSEISNDNSSDALTERCGHSETHTTSVQLDLNTSLSSVDTAMTKEHTSVSLNQKMAEQSMCSTPGSNKYSMSQETSTGAMTGSDRQQDSKQSDFVASPFTISSVPDESYRNCDEQSDRNEHIDEQSDRNEHIDEQSDRNEHIDEQSDRNEHIVVTTPNTSSAMDQPKKETKAGSSKSIKNFLKQRRYVIMFAWITAMFLFSYVFHEILVVAVSLRPAIYSGLSMTQRSIHNLLIWFVFINNSFNWVIYCYFEAPFRREIKRWYSKVSCKLCWK